MEGDTLTFDLHVRLRMDEIRNIYRQRTKKFYVSVLSALLFLEQ